MKKILSISNLSKSYINNKGITNAVENVSFDVYDDDFIAIVGPSGCGKSTILSIIGNLEKKSSGKILCDKNTKIGYMFQEDTLFPWLTVYENCLLGLKIKKELNKESIAYANELIKKYGLYSFKDNYPQELSGGMKQRVALIRTLSTKPDILLLDEPFSALDYQTRIEVSDDVYNIITKEKKTAIIVTHDIAEAVSLANKIIIMTKRPAKIKNIYEINSDSATIPSQRRQLNSFNYYYNLIWKDLTDNE